MSSPYAHKGVGFESLLLAAVPEYLRRGVAWYDKVEVPKGYNKGRLFFKKKTGFDFYGTHWIDIGEGTKIGRSMYFEAKDINETILPLLSPESKNKSGVHYHQLTTLAKLESMNCECFILWRTGGKVYRISPVMAIEIVGIGKNIHREKHSSILTQVPEVRGMVDFLFGLNTRK